MASLSSSAGLPAARVAFRSVKGDGSSAHLKTTVTPPGELLLAGDGSFQLGGAEPATLIVDVPTVSSKHASIAVTLILGADDVASGGGKVQVTDLGSMNGTFIGGKRLKAQKPQDLPLGAEVSFGDDHLALFRLEERPDSDVSNSAAPPAADAARPAEGA